MIKLIIFDFDGVIIDSEELMKYALKICWEKYEKIGSPPYECFFSHMGRSLEEIFDILGLPLSLVSVYRNISIENIDMIDVFPDTQLMLDRLKVLGIRCVLLTGKDRKRTYQILDKTDLKKYFSYVVTPNDVWFTKPHPEGIIHILDEMNCTNDEAMMVGDSINDILCASAAQVTSVQFSFLGKCKALVEADYIVENWIEFCDLVYKTV